MKYTFIVAAAGVGKRMGLSYPKQFLDLKGKPIFVHTLEKINQNKLVDEIIVVTNEEYIEVVEQYCKKHFISKVKTVIAGGKERQDSIYNALQECKESDIIAVQDGVRPFIENNFIEKAYIEITKNNVDGVIIGVPVKDTIKTVDEEGYIVSTPDRKTMIAAQTPQVFKGSILKDAYENAKAKDILFTDDSSLVESEGKRIKVIMGSYNNIKITTKEDLKYIGG